MDFRTPRQADSRGAASRPRSAQRPIEEAQPEAPKAVYRSVPTNHATGKKSSKKFWIPGLAVAILALGAIGWFAWSGMGSAGTGIDGSKYQAIFFTNGQVYFGKLHAFNDKYMKLTEVYYLRTSDTKDADSQNPQKTAADQNNVQLIKLGDEIHGPQDEMVISRDQVLFYENLKPDGKVSQSIDKFKKSN